MATDHSRFPRNHARDWTIERELFDWGYKSEPHARGEVKPSQVKEEHLLPFFVVTRANVNNPAVKKYFYKASCG